ncbi:MAG: tetratricopeptide repeat protein, partial [Pseudomonadota bacterium]
MDPPFVRHTPSQKDGRKTKLIALSLVLVTLALYWQVRNHAFINYDDDVYVTENHHVRAGLTGKCVFWAFKTTVAGLWHPLTLLSHMLDCQLFGLNPGRHHLTNLFFHIANTLLLFLVFKKMTGALYRSAFVAALFALHPLHVESVAWVAERKDVLSTFFWMLTLWAYAFYAKAPDIQRYLLVLLFFALGLMAKPMLVTLPFVLLLLDYWPLSRIQFGDPKKANLTENLTTIEPEFRRSQFFHLVLEKVPLLLLASGSIFLTFLAQKQWGAVAPLDDIPLDVRTGNALISYIIYMGKMFWPHHLAVFYPHPGMPPIWQATGSALLLFTLSILVIKVARPYPYVPMGWLWYLGTLLPVIGLVQVGSQALADRYTYVPLIGLFVILAWGLPGILLRFRFRKILLSGAAAVLIPALMISSWLQIRHWKTSITLFEHTLEVTDKNYLAHYNLGVALQKMGRMDESMTHYGEVLKIRPYYEEAHNNLGVLLAQRGRLKEAIGHFLEALRIRPEDAQAYNNLGHALTLQGKIDVAIASYHEALRIQPNDAEVHYNLGIALSRQDKLDQAMLHYRRALLINPG